MTAEPTRRPRKAVGPDRPGYLDGADTDKVAAIVLALASEVAALRERLDTHERLAASQTAATVEQVELYRPDDNADTQRAAWRAGFIRRLFRVITEDLDATASPESPKSA